MYNDFNKSVENSSPIELYIFQLGTSSFHYTSAEVNYSLFGITYKSISGLKNKGITDGQEANKNDVTVIVPIDLEIPQYLIEFIPSFEISVTINELERHDPDQEIIQKFKGIYQSYKYKYPEFSMKFSPFDADLKKQTMRYTFGPICQHTQYDNQCGLDRAVFAFQSEVFSITGLQVEINSTMTLDTYYGGYIEIQGSNGPERAWIIEQIDSTNLEIDRKIPALQNGAAITIYPSCRGDFDRCRDPALFNNQSKFFGGVHANKVNPFNSTGARSDV